MDAAGAGKTEPLPLQRKIGHDLPHHDAGHRLDESAARLAVGAAGCGADGPGFASACEWPTAAVLSLQAGWRMI